MKTITHLVPLVAFVSLVAARPATQIANAFPNGFAISGTPAFSGTGCPSGTASVSTNSGAQQVYLVYGAFSVSAGPGIPSSDGSKSCAASIAFTIPSGFRLRLSSASTQGSVELDSGKNAQVQAQFGLSDSSNTVRTKALSTFHSSLTTYYHDLLRLKR